MIQSQPTSSRNAKALALTQQSLTNDDGDGSVYGAPDDESSSIKGAKLTAVNAQLKERYGRWQARQSHGGEYGDSLPSLTDGYHHSSAGNRTSSQPSSPSSLLPALRSPSAKKLGGTSQLSLLNEPAVTMRRRHAESESGDGGGKARPRLVVASAAKPCFGRTMAAAPAAKLPWIVRHEYKLTPEKAGRPIPINRIENRDYSLETLTALPKVQLKVAAPTTNGSHWGISLRFLLQFTESMELTMSTRDVVTSFILAQTETSKSRYTDLLPKRVLGRPAYFVSHCWSHHFYDLAYNVFRWFRSQSNYGFIDLDNTFIWIDIFSVNQHSTGPNAESPEAVLATVKEVLAGSQATLFCLDRTATGLKRLWCLYEVWLSLTETRSKAKSRSTGSGAAAVAAAKRDAALELQEPAPTLHLLMYGAEWESVRSAYNTLNVQTAKASLDGDAVRLQSAISASASACENPRSSSSGDHPVNSFLRSGLLECVLADAAATPAVSPEVARSGSDERGVELFCAAQTTAAAWEMMAGQLAAAAQRVSTVVALRIAAAEGAKVKPDANSGVIVMDPQLMQVAQLLTLALREAEMYDDVKVVCEAFRVQAVLAGLMATIGAKPTGAASVSSVTAHMGASSPRVGDLSPLLGSEEDEGLTRVIRAYMHLENCLIEAIALGGGWAGAAPDMAAGPPGTKASKSVAGAALVALHDMHMRADTVLQCAVRRRTLFRRAIVHTLYNQVILEYASALPALARYWTGHRQAQLEMEVLDLRCKAITEMAHVNAKGGPKSIIPVSFDDRDDATTLLAANRLRQAMETENGNSEMKALHVRRCELSAALAFPPIGDMRSRLAELGRWVKTVNSLEVGSETFLKSLRSAVAIEMIIEEDGT